MTSVRRSSRLRDRSRSQRRARLVSDGKGMFVGVVRNVQQKHFCKGIDCSVDLATRTLERKPTLWVIASGATATKCRRQWNAFLLDPAFQRRTPVFL